MITAAVNVAAEVDPMDKMVRVLVEAKLTIETQQRELEVLRAKDAAWSLAGRLLNSHHSGMSTTESRRDILRSISNAVDEGRLHQMRHANPNASIGKAPSIP